MERASNISTRDIYLTLKKLRLDIPSAVLAHEFGLSETSVCRIFRNTLTVISKVLKQLIVWPKQKDILLNLPIQFRLRYHKVQFIIDCMEIEIEKPSDAFNQAMTWYSYKNCNTSKYLIAVSPDGLIVFVSEGFGGRTSDIEIVKNSGFLNVLPENSLILADRGFKNLESLLIQKNCTLVRPPSVSDGKILTEEEVKLTKQVASLRIHVERVIQRIRNFRFVDIHSRTNKDLLDCLDPAVNVAGALVNLQSRVIKQS